MTGPPPPGAYPYQPYQPMPQPPQRRSGLRKGCLIGGLGCGGLIVVVIIIAAIGAAVGGSKSSNSGSQAASGSGGGAPAASAEPGPGQVARDGDFAFVLQSSYCGNSAARAVGEGGFGESVPASAIECIFTIKVTDDEGTAQTFFDGNQYAYDSAGQQFSADNDGGTFLKGDQDDTQVNPGITITAKVPFQIPRGVKITRLVLHDSAFSGGVTVKV